MTTFATLRKKLPCKTHLSAFNEKNRYRFDQLLKIFEKPECLDTQEDTAHLTNTLNTLKEKDKSDISFEDIKSVLDHTKWIQQKLPTTGSYKATSKRLSEVNTWEAFEDQFKSLESEEDRIKKSNTLTILNHKISEHLSFLPYSPQVIRRLLEEALPALESYLTFAQEEYAYYQNKLSPKEQKVIEAYLASQWYAFGQLKYAVLTAAWLRLDTACRMHSLQFGDAQRYFVGKLKELDKNNTETFTQYIKNSPHYWLLPEDIQVFQKHLSTYPMYAKQFKQFFWLHEKEDDKSDWALIPEPTLPLVVPQAIKLQLPASTTGWVFYRFVYPYAYTLWQAIQSHQGLWLSLKSLPASFKYTIKDVKVGCLDDPHLKYLNHLQDLLIEADSNTPTFKPSIWHVFSYQTDLANTWYQSYKNQAEGLLAIQFECLTKWLDTLEFDRNSRAFFLLTSAKQGAVIKFADRAGVEKFITKIQDALDHFCDKQSTLYKRYASLNEQWQSLHNACEALTNIQSALLEWQTGKLLSEEDYSLVREYYQQLPNEKQYAFRSEVKPLLEPLVKDITTLIDLLKNSQCPDENLQARFNQAYDFIEMVNPKGLLDDLKDPLKALLPLYYQKGAGYTNDDTTWFEHVETLLISHAYFKTYITELKTLRCEQPDKFQIRCAKHCLKKIKQEFKEVVESQHHITDFFKSKENTPTTQTEETTLCSTKTLSNNFEKK